MGKIALIFSCGLLFASVGGEGSHLSAQATQPAPLEIYEADLSERGLVVAVIGAKDCEFTVEQILEFQRNHTDPEMKQMNLLAAAFGAAIDCALAAGIPPPIQILADPNAAGAT